MDNPPLNQQKDIINYSQQNKKTGKFFLAEFIVLIIVIFLMFAALNYFKILPISSLFPGQQSKPTPAAEKDPRTSSLFKINCPIIKEFCYNWHEIIKDYKYIGLGYELSSGSAIFAAFDGNLSATNSAISTEIEGKTVPVKFKTVYLDNPNNNFRAIYFLRGDIIKTGKVSKGEQIAIANGKEIIIYDNSSLVFSLFVGNPDKTIPVFINNSYFE